GGGGGVDGTKRSALVTFGLDHSLLRDAASRAGTDEFLSGSDPVWRASFGATGQLAAEFGRRLYINAGVRLEHTTGFIAQDIAAALPSLGAAWVHDAGPLSFKLRGAYGRAIRSPREAGYRLASALSPEQQQGIEVGADINIGSHFAVRVTRFDQLARDLVQPVLATITSTARPGLSTEPTRQFFTLQNVGVISNRGWEFQANGVRGPLNLSGSLGLVESRVVHVASGYTGDLRAGDRTLQVPGLTASAAATWSGRSWTSTLSVARASDWVSYDRIRLTDEASDLVVSGAALRSYWLNYPGVTRLRASFSRELSRGFLILLSGDNLLGTQRGEPDNITVLPGRTLTAGLRALFR
ncbi:MAG: TonB-dependent receptor domain-containing protein, partial [Gemmatimonadota bacterium]